MVTATRTRGPSFPRTHRVRKPSLPLQTSHTVPTNVHDDNGTESVVQLHVWQGTGTSSQNSNQKQNQKRGGLACQGCAELLAARHAAKGDCSSYGARDTRLARRPRAGGHQTSANGLVRGEYSFLPGSLNITHNAWMTPGSQASRVRMTLIQKLVSKAFFLIRTCSARHGARPGRPVCAVRVRLCAVGPQESAARAWVAGHTPGQHMACAAVAQPEIKFMPARCNVSKPAYRSRREDERGQDQPYCAGLDVSSEAHAALLCNPWSLIVPLCRWVSGFNAMREAETKLKENGAASPAPREGRESPTHTWEGQPSCASRVFLMIDIPVTCPNPAHPESTQLAARDFLQACACKIRGAHDVDVRRHHRGSGAAPPSQDVALPPSFP